MRFYLIKDKFCTESLTYAFIWWGWGACGCRWTGWLQFEVNYVVGGALNNSIIMAKMHGNCVSRPLLQPASTAHHLKKRSSVALSINAKKKVAGQFKRTTGGARESVLFFLCPESRSPLFYLQGHHSLRYKYSPVC